MRVLLLAVTAAVVGTLLLEHMRLKALTMPQQLVQPVWQAGSHPAASEPIHHADPSQLEHQHGYQQQQQVAPDSAAAHLMSAQQTHEVPTNSLQPMIDSHLDLLPRKR